MTTFRAIASTETDPQAPVTSALMKALEANHKAAMEGDATAIAAGVTLLDPALDTGAATAAGTTWVALRTAGLAVGAVGSYALLNNSATPGGITTVNPGTTVAGSGLIYTNAIGANVSSSPSGTWRSMGYHQTAPTGTIPLIDGRRVTLWLRIS